MTIETKYNIGDEVLGYIARECFLLRVVGIRILWHKSDKSINYILAEDGVDLTITLGESRLFLTKEELIKSL